MKLGKIFAFLCIAGMGVVSCVKDPVEEKDDKENQKPAGREEMTFTATLPDGLTWKEGASISVFDEKYNNTYTLTSAARAGIFGGTSFAADSYKALYPANNKATVSSDGTVHTNLPSRLSCAPGAGSPEGLYAAEAKDGTLAFEGLLSTVKFTLTCHIVTSISFSALSGNGLAGDLAISFPDGVSVAADSTQIVLTPASGSTFEPGDYCFPLVAGSRDNGIEIKIYNTREPAVVLNPEALSSLASGQTADLGVIDGSLAPKVGQFVLPVHFKIPEKLLDPTPETGTGSAWPFTEDSGNSGHHAFNMQLHTTEGGYPVIWSGKEYYLNTKGGLQFYCENPLSYFEFPTFANGKVVSISAAFGNVPAPYVTDEFGNVIPGGEPRTGLIAGKLFEWNLTGTEYGQPVRFVVGKSGGQILQFNVTYEMLGDEVLNEIESVTVSDGGNASFGKGKIDITAAVKLKDGATETSPRCVIEYRDIMESGPYTVLECTPDNFKCTIDNLTADAYDVRAWAISRNGWRVYANELTAYASCLKVDFWVNEKGNQPFTVNMPTGATAGQEQAGKEQVWTLKGCDAKIATFTPEGHYIDLNTARACRISSSGVDVSPCTYVKFPAVPGKALREIIVTRGISPGANFMVCKDPNDAKGTAVSAVLNLATAGDTGSLVCPMTSENTAYYLVFPDQVFYNLCNAHAIYEASGAPGEGAPDDQTLNPDDPSADPTGVFDYSKLSAKDHPRVLIDKAGFADIRRKVTDEAASNVFLTSLNNYIISRANIYINAPITVTYTLDASGTRLLEQSRRASQQLLLMSYAYQITGQTKYVTRCRKILKDVCSFPDWHPSHFLDVAEMSLGVGVAYDWLYPALSTEEKVMIKNALVNFGLKAGFQYGASKFYNSDNNWNQVCNGGLLAAAIAVYDKDKADAAQTIEKAYETNKIAMGKIYSPDGNYAEGYGYWGYGTGYQALIMQMLETAFGTTAGLAEVDGFLKTAGFMQFMVGPCGPFGYADGGTTSESSSIGMWWFAGHMKDKSLLCNEMRLYDKGNYAAGDDERYLPLAAVVAKDLNLDGYNSVYPAKNVWSGNGKVPVVMVHTGWKFDAGDHYLGIKGGSANSAHGHMDAGTFVYDALGQRWSIDVTRPSYATMENALRVVGGSFWSVEQQSFRWDITSMNNWFHSTISVGANDGSIEKTYPTDHNVKGKCTVTTVLDSSTEKGAVLDMSAPLKGQVASARRTIKLVNEKDLVVIDEITALSTIDAPLYWHMVTPAQPTASAECVTLTSGSKTMYLTTVSSDASVKPSYTVSDCVRPSTWTPRDWDPSLAKYKITGYECTVPAGKTVVLTTKLSPDK